MTPQDELTLKQVIVIQLNREVIKHRTGKSMYSISLRAEVDI